MSFPHCKHAKRKKRLFATPLLWLGSEPYRLFFLSGILFGIAGVLMWPLFYKGKLSFYPGISHAHVMIQAFGGGFVIGFLGTAGPRILTAPRLKPWELAPLFALHVARPTKTPTANKEFFFVNLRFLRNQPSPRSPKPSFLPTISPRGGAI